MGKESYKEHPAYKKEDLEIKTPEELEEDRQRLLKEVMEGAKNISINEIKTWNFEMRISDTEFIERTLECLKKILKLKDFEDFNKAISKYPVVDLACGQPDRILNFLFKEKWHNSRNYYDKKTVDKVGIAEPPKYIGIDKYQENFVGPQNKKLSDRIKFEKKDIIEFLRTLPDNSVNIFIGGFGWEISEPKRGEDKYRAIMIAEIARVLAKGGYCLAADSKMHGQWEGHQIIPEDFGLKKIFYLFSEPSGVEVKLFKKPKEKE